jgi:glycosyltransferase involved in cell wall biosynthesis
MTILAKELVNRGYDVSVITFDKSTKSPEIINGLKVYNAFNKKESSYSYLHPLNTYKLLKILYNIDADIHIQRAGTPLTGIIAFFARIRNKVFIFSSSSNGNVSTAMRINSIKELGKLIFRYGVQNSDCVVCQSKYQKELLWQTIKKDGIVIKNVYILPRKSKMNNHDSKKVLTVSRIGREKRMELFLKLSKKNPDINFIIIGGPSKTDKDYYNHLKAEAKNIQNLEFLGFIPHKEIDRYYQEASMFVSTSQTEGFPNTFLEAWGNGIPVISFGFDPDDIISKYELGFHPTNFDELEENVYALLQDEKLRNEMGKNGRKYVIKEHSIDKIVDEYEELFDILVKQ